MRLGGFEQNQHGLFGTIFVTRCWRTQTPRPVERVTPFKTMENSMASKEEAELLFKQELLSGSRGSIPEYEQRARAERIKTARLRVLRLAREANSATNPEEIGRTKEKLAQPKSSKILRRQTGIR
jgi:hypothetical protein